MLKEKSETKYGENKVEMERRRKRARLCLYYFVPQRTNGRTDGRADGRTCCPLCCGGCGGVCVCVCVRLVGGCCIPEPLYTQAGRYTTASSRQGRRKSRGEGILIFGEKQLRHDTQLTFRPFRRTRERTSGRSVIF